MGRLYSINQRYFCIALLIAFFSALTACSGGGNATNIVNFTTPTFITLAPSSSASMDIGSTLVFTATPEDSSGAAVPTPVSYISSNPAVLTVANNGLACAGTWDSQANPQICTPGPPGVAQVSAIAQGVSSPSTTVFVHQHIDNIQVSLIPSQTQPTSFQSFGCFSAGQTVDLQATAYSRGQSGLSEITSTVGVFAWQVVNGNVASVTGSTLSTPINGLQAGQAQVNAKSPGITTLLASVGNTISVPFTFITCPVQSIQLAVNGSSAPTLSIAQAGSLQLSTTVTDIAGTVITGVPITWSSSSPRIITVPPGSNDTATGSITSVGGSAISVSCTPPSCNIGFLPSLPVYASHAIDVNVGANSSGTAASAKVSVTSTGCKQFDSCAGSGCPVMDKCVTTLVSVGPVSTSGAGTLTINPSITLPSRPDSLTFDPQGTNLFMGTDTGAFGTKGVMNIANGSNTATQFTTAAGTILAVSPSGAKIILSDTQDTPQQVFVFDTSTHDAVTLPISGATAAAFSPDNLKAYILAGSTLYVFSQQDALQTLSLAAPATDVAFNSNGMLGYIAGGDPAGVLFGSVCDGSPVLSPVASPNVSLIRELPNGSLLTLSTSNQFGMITPAFAGTPSGVDFLGCPSTRQQNWPTGVLAQGFIHVSNTQSNTVNLGPGFTPSQLLVSSDGSRAYVLAPNLATILVYNINNGTTSSIALAGNAGPVRGALTGNGSLLFVVATDGKLHELNTATQIDTQQVSFPDNFCEDSEGNSAPFTCLPDLIAVTP